MGDGGINVEQSQTEVKRPAIAGSRRAILQGRSGNIRDELSDSGGWPRFDSAALKAAAYRSHREPLPDDLVDELTWCSETFVEYGHYLQEARFARRVRFAAVCLVVAIGLAAALLWYLDTLG